MEKVTGIRRQKQASKGSSKEWSRSRQRERKHGATDPSEKLDNWVRHSTASTTSKWKEATEAVKVVGLMFDGNIRRTIPRWYAKEF